MSITKKLLLGAGIIVGIVVIFALNSNPSPEISPSQSFNKNNYNPVSNSSELNAVLPKLNSTEINTESDCHPSYSGACLNPNASDYDCRSGSGNGPYYTGKVRVVGPDVFRLDRDGDGWGCE